MSKLTSLGENKGEWANVKVLIKIRN